MYYYDYTAQQIGVELVNMDRVQIHPTGFIDPSNPSVESKILAPEALRGSGGILVNQDGMRFANELGSRSYLSEHIEHHCKAFQTRFSFWRTPDGGIHVSQLPG